MERTKLKSTIEAILFACGTPVEVDRIAQALEISPVDASDICELLLREYADEDKGMRIVRLNKSYQMCTREEYADPIRTVMDIKRNAPLSQAAAEVLAVIAYNQPGDVWSFREDPLPMEQQSTFSGASIYPPSRSCLRCLMTRMSLSATKRTR